MGGFTTLMIWLFIIDASYASLYLNDTCLDSSEKGFS